MNHSLNIPRNVSLSISTLPSRRNYFFPYMYLSMSFCFLEQSPPQHFAVTCFLKCPIYYFAITLLPTLAWMLTANSCCGIRSLSFTQILLENSKAFDLWTMKVRASMGSPMMWIITFSILDFQKPSNQKSMEPQPLLMDLIQLLKLRMTSLSGSRQRRIPFDPYSLLDSCLPRLFQHMDYTYFTTQIGTMTFAFTICSYIQSTYPFSGHQDAFSRSSIYPFRVLQRQGTDGLVIIMSELPNQAQSLCLKIYIWRTPRNPTLKPLPSAAEDSFEILTEGSIKASLQRFFQSQGVLFGFTEQRPANTTGLAGQKPVKGFTGLPILQKVSPILASLTCFMLVATQPIIPGLSYSTGSMLGLSTPTSKT